MQNDPYFLSHSSASHTIKMCKHRTLFRCERQAPILPQSLFMNGDRYQTRERCHRLVLGVNSSRRGVSHAACVALSEWIIFWRKTAAGLMTRETPVSPKCLGDKPFRIAGTLKASQKRCTNELARMTLSEKCVRWLQRYVSSKRWPKDRRRGNIDYHN